MPKRQDIESVLLIGSGPIVIGQACEFDYSGTQAIKALKEEGYRTILVNSNPATIMTDPDLADKTYIEPLVFQVLVEVIEKEKPDAILPTLGGQTALNLAMELYNNGVLRDLNVELIGAKPDAIKCAEDRDLFKLAMEEIGLRVPLSEIANSLEQAYEIARKIGFPIMIRPSFILGGEGTGICRNESELKFMVERALSLSPIGTALIEQSLEGWKEFELEVMRDKADNAVVICTIENFDPMGVHTGDSITVAPAQTLNDKDYQLMRDSAFSCIRRVDVETGGSNIQFALNPNSGEMMVIEMNPRVSRSSALASKATGFPIAKIAAKLAVGYRLDELPNDITKKTPASFEPTIDYVVTKIPRWAFEKLPRVSNVLGTRMQSVGEVMAIGRNFQESLQKAIRGLEIGRYGLNSDKAEEKYLNLEKDELLRGLFIPTPERIFYIAEALRRGYEVDEIASLTNIDPWFLSEIKLIIEKRKELGGKKLKELSRDELFQAKQLGFSDNQLGYLLDEKEEDVRAYRISLGIEPVFKTVDTCSSEFEALTPYHYSTYENDSELASTDKDVVVVIGAGPNRIGQGIEFDYCCCHAVEVLSEVGFETVMINCNPETVSTDYDTSDKLFFDPITFEDVSYIIKSLNDTCRNLKGVIVTLGGQTPLKLASLIDENLILGTKPSSIDIAEDRFKWNSLCNELNILQPKGKSVISLKDALEAAREIKYPILLRPSYVLGGRAMEIIYSDAELKDAWQKILESQNLLTEDSLTWDSPILIDEFLEDAIEVDVDALRSKDAEILIGGIMQHVEEAGVHSGDSACVVPPVSLSEALIQEIESIVVKIGNHLNVVGPYNVQLAIKDKDVYVLEGNPRASRTLPFVSKSVGIQLAKIAALFISGFNLEEVKKLQLLKEDITLKNGYVNLSKEMNKFCVKEAVLPFKRFLEADSILGPEMRSTGEVMGIDKTFGRAFYKSQLGAGSKLPKEGTVFFSVADKDKKEAVSIAREFQSLGFRIAATPGTKAYLEKNNVKVDKEVAKLAEEKDGVKNVLELIDEGKIDLIINTPRGRGARADGAYIRIKANEKSIPCITTIAAAKACALGMKETLASKKRLLSDESSI